MWFALTFWLYLTTKSVISTSTLSGIWLVSMALSSFWLGSFVDHYKKKHVMLGSSIATFLLFLVGFVVFNSNPVSAFATVGSPLLWVFVLILVIGVIAGSVYQIAVPTLVAFIVPENMRDKANGMFGTVMGISFAITSVASGLVLAKGGMYWVLLIALVATALAIGLLALLPIAEKKVAESHSEAPKRVDLKGTIAAISAVPGLFALILFTTINNFLGGVFMALMDAYGLTLVSVQVWGFMLGALSSGFILGGMYITKKGLGNDPLARLFQINTIMWIVSILFVVQPSIILFGAGMFIWMTLVPFVEATEQTIFQKVVPPERLGRVFGFAHSVEQSASPITSFLIGPIAQLVFIPFMTTGKGIDLIGSRFGVGTGRGIALVFITAGTLGLIITQFARNSRYCHILAKQYNK